LVVVFGVLLFSFQPLRSSLLSSVASFRRLCFACFRAKQSKKTPEREREREAHTHARTHRLSEGGVGEDER
jgi:hypothetical protein